MKDLNEGASGQPASTGLPSDIDLLRRIIDQAAIGMVLLGADGRWIFANRIFCTLTGYSQGDGAGRPIDDLIDPDEREEMQRHLGALGIEGGETDIPECRYIRKNGSAFQGRTSISVLPQSAVRFIVQVVDIGLQKQTDADVREAEQRWSVALENSRHVVWDVDVPTEGAWFSPRWTMMLGLPADQQVRSVADWLKRVHPDDADGVLAVTDPVLTGTLRDFEAAYRVRHADGRWLWVSSRGRVAEYAADGSPLRMVGTLTDITHEKEMEARLASATERLEIALEAGGIGTFEVDLETRSRRWDARTCALHGVPPEASFQTFESYLGCIHPDDVHKIRDGLAAARRQPSGYQLDYRVRRGISSGIRHIRATIRLIPTADGPPRVGVGACWDITQDVERTRQLRDTLALLQGVMDGTPDLIFTKDLEGRYLLVNGSVERLMGRTGADIIGRTDSEIFAPETARPLIENDRHVLQSGQPQTTEETAPLDGALRTYSSTKAPYRDEQGRIVSLIGISRDITDVKAAEAALRRSEARWQFAFDGSGDGIWDWNLETGYVFYSPQWKTMLGCEEDDVGTTVQEWIDRVHPEDLPECWGIIQDHLAGQTPHFAFELRMRAKDGTWRWIHDRGKVIERAEDGRPLRIIGTHTDITARKESEAAILALNQRLQLAIASSGAGIFELDFATERFAWDGRMYELYDLPPGRYDGTLETWLGFIHPDDVPEVLRRYEAAVSETSIFSMDFRIRRQRSGAARHIRSLARIIRDDQDAPIRAVGMNWDITDHRELAEALFEEKERLQITLHSIGDGVISTDAQARVTFMNPIAERMTGWTAADAAGLPLREVFRIIDEATGETIPDPVEACLERMQPYYLNDGAVLLGRDGERCSIRDSAAPVRTAKGEIIGAVLVFQDVTKARTLQQALEHSASHDSLTGLPNRMAFEQGLSEASREARKERRSHVLCFIDLDRFKIVNDGAGHAAGDALLREVANLLRRSCRAQDLAARLGGDEFALLLRDCTIDEGDRIARRFLHDVAALRFTWDSRSYQIGASIGLTRVSSDRMRPDELMSQADIACYTAKTAGRNRVSIYGGNGSAARQHHREIQVAAGIRNAIEGNRFRLFAQEILSLKDTAAAGRHYEILLRMVDDNGGIVEPAAFIPASERYDLMGNIDRWVIHTTLRTYGPRLRVAEDLSVAINLSANSLNDPFLWPFLQDELDASGLPARRLHFEITETAVINNLSAAKQFLSRARAAGCGVILDDFGAGHSSFTYLRQFPVDGVKIDGSFIRQMAGSEVDRAIVESINTIGHRLGAVTVAEQVEDDHTLNLVRAIGVDRAQGFVIGRPRPLDTLL